MKKPITFWSASLFKSTVIELICLVIINQAVLCDQSLDDQQILQLDSNQGILASAVGTSEQKVKELEINLTNTNQALQSAQDQSLYLIDQELIRPANQRKCVPYLNLLSHFSSTNITDSPTTTTTPQATTSPTFVGPKSSFSFDIADIDMPVSPPSVAPFNSAMKLISSFGSQFDDMEQADVAMENVVRFKENHLQLQGLNMSMLNVHLYTDSDPKFAVGVSIKNTTLTGRFSYRGPLAAISGADGAELAGFYRMSIDNIYLIASSNLTKQLNNVAFSSSTSLLNQSDNVTVNQQPNLTMSLVTNEFKLNISNLGYISIDILDSKDSTKSTSNYLLRMLQRILQKTIKRTYYTFENYIRETLEREGRHTLDCELSRFTPLLDASGLSSHQSDLARIISGEIVRSQLATVPLPAFEHQQSVFGTSATIQFNNGSLSGLDHVKLNSETRIKLQDEHLFINTSIGWTDLKPYYDWNLTMGASKTPISRGFVSFKIKAVSCCYQLHHYKYRVQK